MNTLFPQLDRGRRDQPKVVMVCRLARGKWSLSLLTWLWCFSAVAIEPMLVSATSSWISAVVWPFCWMAPPGG